MSFLKCLHFTLAFSLAAGHAAADEPLNDQKAIATAFLDALTKGDFDAASKSFDATMKKRQPPEKLAETWKAILSQLGPLQKRLGTRTEAGAKYDFVFLTCQFEKQKLDIRVVFDKEKNLAGFTLTPTKPTEFATPPYAKRDAFREEEVVVGKDGEWPLPGALTLPTGNGPFASVILVHGSGPHDRDETIGPNKVFRDLAWGLASQGIAVLRYEKRNKEHRPKVIALKSFTLQDETIDDACAAVALLRTHKAIDPKRIYVAGHSLGATAAPRIGEREPGLAGLILLAGNSRPLEDLIVEQFTYLFSMTGEISAANQKELDKIKKQVAKVKDPALAVDTPRDELPLTIPAGYWLYLREYNPVATAAKLKMPIFVVQGERDYQVTMEDFAGWQKGLAARKDVRLQSYPKLNHLFMDGTGKSRPEEYNKADHVAKVIVDDLAAWIGRR